MTLSFPRNAVTVGILAGASAVLAVFAACSSKTPAATNGDAGGSSSGSTGNYSPCATVFTCASPSLDITYTPMYSAYITDDDSGMHQFQLPAVVKNVDNTTVQWGVSDPSAVECTPIPASEGGGVLITVAKPGSVTLVAQTNGKCGQSTLEVSQALLSQWQAGNNRYNNNIPLYGGCIGLGHHFPDGGKGACPKVGPACTTCHGTTATKNPFFHDVAHTPTQTAGFSDTVLINLFRNGIVPDGGYFDPSIVSYPSWQLFHQWTDIQGSDEQAMVIYLRSLVPSPQTGTAVDSGSGDDGGGNATDATAPVTAPSCGPAGKCMLGQVCCVGSGQQAPDNDAGGGPPSGMCTDVATCNSVPGNFALTCDGEQDCPAGNVCCAQFGVSSSTSVCQPSCGSQAQICLVPKECDVDDSGGYGCRSYPYAGGIQTCLALRGDGGKGKDGATDEGGTDEGGTSVDATVE